VRPPASPGTVALAACLCVCLVAPATAPAAAGDRLVVDADGAGYDAVAPAVAAADPGDTVVVRPGRYHPSVVLDRSVTVVAPDGATLAGTGGREGAAFTIPRGSDAAPTVAGFTVVDYGGGLLLAERTTGDWRLRDLTVGNVSYVVVATHATGDWTLRNVTATGGGVLAPSSTGDWTVRNLTLRDTGGRALYTAYAEGDWTVRGARLRRVDRAVDAHGTDGDWTVAATTVRNATVGVDAEGAGGDWTVRRSRFVDVAAADGEFGRGTTVLAADTGGEWTVTRSAFVDGDADEPVVDATGARPDGDATDNWWGHPAGPDPPDCVGAVDCGAALRATPTAGAGVVGPGADGATPAPPETTAGTTATPDAGRTAGVDTGPDDGEPAVTPGPETATPGPETATTTAGSLALSPVPAAVALVLAGLVGALAGRIRP
jgi:hypothetical protein